MYHSDEGWDQTVADPTAPLVLTPGHYPSLLSSNHYANLRVLILLAFFYMLPPKWVFQSTVGLIKSVFVVYLPSPTQHCVCQMYPFCCREFHFWLYHHCFPFCDGVYGLFWGPQPTEHFWSMYQCWLSPLGSSILSYLSQQCSPSFPSTTSMVLQCFSLTSLPQCSPQEILVFLRYLYLLIVHIITRQPLLMFFVFFWMIFHDFLPSFTPIPG